MWFYAKNTVKYGASMLFEVFLKILENILEIILAMIWNITIPVTHGEFDTLGAIILQYKDAQEKYMLINHAKRSFSLLSIFAYIP